MNVSWKIGTYVAPVMRASLPCRGIGAYAPTKDSVIGWWSIVRKDRRVRLWSDDGDRISKD